jgi:hypothetical protein
MLSAILLAISIVALSQFALYYWRAVVAGVAAQPISGRVLVAADIGESRIEAQHFGKLSGLLEVTPRLRSGDNGLGLVRFYYHTVRLIGALAGRRIPALVAWSQRECGVCARYAAVQIDRRLEANLALAASMRSC